MRSVMLLAAMLFAAAFNLPATLAATSTPALVGPPAGTPFEVTCDADGCTARPTGRLAEMWGAGVLLGNTVECGGLAPLETTCEAMFTLHSASVPGVWATAGYVGTVHVSLSQSTGYWNFACTWIVAGVVPADCWGEYWGDLYLNTWTSLFGGSSADVLFVGDTGGVGEWGVVVT